MCGGSKNGNSQYSRDNFQASKCEERQVVLTVGRQPEREVAIYVTEAALEIREPHADAHEREKDASVQYHVRVKAGKSQTLEICVRYRQNDVSLEA